jgi:hypothetical protein
MVAVGDSSTNPARGPWPIAFNSPIKVTEAKRVEVSISPNTETIEKPILTR